MNIQEIRKRVPALAGLDDQTLMDTVHQQYFADTPVNDFYKQFNYQPKSQAGEGTSALRFAGDVGIKLAQGVVDLGSSAVGVGSLLTGGLLGKGMRAIGYDPQATNDALGEYLSDAQKASDKKVAEADGFFDTIGQSIANSRSIVGGIAQSMPGMLGAMSITRAVAGKLVTSAALATAEGQAASKAVIAAGGSGENAIAAALSTTAGKEAAEKALEASATRLLATGAATEGVQTAGQIADDAQAKGRDYADYALPAVAAGVGTAAIGLGAGKLMGDAATSIATGSKAAGVKGNWAQQIGKEFLSEGVLEEMPQSAQEQFFTNMAQGNANLMDGVANAAGSGLVVGGVQGAAMGGIQDLARHRTKLLKDTGPLSRASNAVTESRQEPSVPMLPYNPDALITFKDGTTARQSQLDAMLAKLPTEQEKMELRAKILGYEPEAADQPMQHDPLVAFPEGIVVPQDKVESTRQMRDQAQKTSDENRIKQAESSPRSWSLEDAQAMSEAAKAQGRDLYVVPHLDNGYTLLPKKWLSPQDIHEYAPLQIRTAQPESNAEQQNAPEQPSEALGVSAEAPAVSGQALGVSEQDPAVAQEQASDEEGNLDNSVDESLLKDLVADTDARVAGGDQQRVEAHRAAVLDGVLSSDSAPGRSVASLAREFSKKLAESGVKQTMTTDAELQRLRRFVDVSAAALSEPVQQDNLSGLVKERQQSQETNSNKKAQFDAVDRAIAQGMRLKVPSGSVLTKKGSSKIFRLNDAQKAHYAKQIATIEGQQAGATPDVVSAAPAEVEAPAQSRPPAPVQQAVVQKEIPAGNTDNVQSPDKTPAPAPVQVAQQTIPEQQGQKAPANDLRHLAVEAMEQQLRQLRAGMARNRTKARSAGSIDEKRHLLEQAEEKEKALRIARQQIFNAEDALNRVVETGDKSHFNDYRAIFPGTADFIDKQFADKPEQLTQSTAIAVAPQKGPSEQYQSYVRHIDQFNDEGRRLSATEQELILSDNRITEDEYSDLQKRIDENRRASAMHTEAHESAASPQNALPEPTPAQAEAGNYKKGHIQLHGLDITVENPKGSTRSGTDETGKRWESTMQHHYGYIKGTVGADGDHIDTFVGPHPNSERVFVVDQVNPRTGAFDEHKVMLGFNSMDEARAGYLANYEQGWTGGRDMVETNLSTFKNWLENGNHKKPFYTAKKQPAPRKKATKEKAAPRSEKQAQEPAQEPWQSKDTALMDALAHLSDVISDAFGAKLNITGPRFTHADILPALAKVMEQMIIRGARSFTEAVKQSSNVMSTVPALQQHLNKISARQWKSAYNVVAEAHAGTDSEESVFKTSADDVLKIVRGAPERTGQVKSTVPDAAELATLRDLGEKAGAAAAANISGWTEKVSGKAKVKKAILESLFKNASSPEFVTEDLASQILKDLQLAANKQARAPQNPGKRESGTLTLRDDFGTESINGYESTAEFPIDPNKESGTQGVKAAFIKDAKAYLSDVATQLEQYGFSSYRDKKGKVQKPVSVNEGGMAVSGDISLAMFNETLGNGIYVNIGEGMSMLMAQPTKSRITVMARVTDPGQPYGGGRNLWLPVDLQSRDLAKRLHDEVSRVSERMQPKEEVKPPARQDAEAKTEQGGLFDDALEKQEDDTALQPYRDQAAVAGLADPLMRQLEQVYHSNDADMFVGELNKELAKALNKLTVNNMTDAQLMLADQLIAGGNALLQKRADSVQKQMQKRGLDTGATNTDAYHDQPAEQPQPVRALSDVIVAISDYEDGNLIRLTLPANQAFNRVDSRIDTLKQLIKCMAS